MPRRDIREKQRKKTRYSSDSSDSEKERSAQRYSRERGRVRHKSSREKSSKYHKRDSSSTRSTSSSSKSSSSSSSSNSNAGKSVKEPKKKQKAATEQQPETKKFDLEELFIAKDQTKLLNDIETDSFVPSAFQSQKKILVDLEKDKIMIPSSSTATNEEESLIHPDFLGNDEKRVDKWIKKLYVYRNQ